MLEIPGETLPIRSRLSREIAPYGRPSWLTGRMTLGTADYRPVCAPDTRSGRMVALPNPSLLQLPEYKWAGWGACGARPRVDRETIVIPPGDDTLRQPDEGDDAP